MKSTVLYRALLYVLLPMLAAHVLVTALYVQQKQEARQVAMQQRVRTAAETIAATINPSDSTASVRLAAVAERQDLARLWLVSDRGILLASSIPSESGSLPDPDWRQAIQEAGGPAGGLSRFVRNGTPYLVAVQPVDRQGTRAVAIYDTTLAGSLSALWATSFLPAALLYLLLAFVLLLFITLAVRRPSERLDLALARLVRGDLNDEVTLQRLHAELKAAQGTLADRFLEIGREFVMLRTHFAETDRRYRAVTELVDELVLLCSFKGYVVDANPAFCHFIGCQPPELRGKPFEALEPHVSFGPLLTLAQRSLNEGVAFDDIEFALRNETGQGLPVRLSLRALPMQDGPMFIVVASDLTSQKTLEQRLHEVTDSVQLMADQEAAGQWLDSVLNATGLLVLAFDAEDRTVLWSEGARALTGLRPADVPDRETALARLLPEHEHAPFAAWLRDESDRTAMLTRFQKGDDPPRQLLWHAATPESGTDAPALVLVGMDVTTAPDPWPAPPALPSGDGTPALPPPAAEAHEDPSLLTLAAHELQPSLKSTAGFVELLALRVEADAETALYLDLIRQAVVRMARLLESVLAYARANSLASVSAWMDTGSLVEDALSRAVPAELPDGRAVQVEIARGMPRAWGNRAQLVLALEHLFAQALRHDAPAPLLEINAQDVDDGTVLQVATNGPAFPEPPPENPAAPFMQPITAPDADETTGLALCGRIVALHEGKAWIERDAGTSRAFLFLPNREVPPPAPPRDRVSEILDALDDADL